jgi:hypothetical protein
MYSALIDIKVRMISYLCKLIQGKQSKLSTIAYKLLYVKNFQNCKISAWINHIHKILNDSGMGSLWFVVLNLHSVNLSLSSKMSK